MTYREAIQKLKDDCNALYEKCGSLRDVATLDEKEYWNDLRGLLGKAYSKFDALDNNLSDNSGDRKLKGTY